MPEAKVFRFPGPRVNQGPFKPFEAIDEDKEIRKQVALTIGRFTHRADVALSKPARILLSRRREDPGTIEVLPMQKKNEFAVITSSKFASWLSEHTTLDLYDSGRLTSYYASAFGAIYGRVNGVNARTNGSYIPEFWDHERQRVALHRLPYRAAGLVALTASAITKPDLPRQEYPPHIAGLVNPLEIHEFKELHDCFKIGRGEQGELGCDS